MGGVEATVRLAWYVPLILLLAACDSDTTPPSVPAELAQGQVAPPKGTDLPTRLDPGTKTEITSSETVEVQGQPACLFTVRYPGQEEQEVTWPGEGCDAVTGTIIPPALLAEGGQLADLPEEARRDMERMAGGLFVVESEFAASAYPINVAGRIYQVPYAN